MFHKPMVDEILNAHRQFLLYENQKDSDEKTTDQIYFNVATGRKSHLEMFQTILDSMLNIPERKILETIYEYYYTSHPFLAKQGFYVAWTPEDSQFPRWVIEFPTEELCINFQRRDDNESESKEQEQLAWLSRKSQIDGDGWIPSNTFWLCAYPVRLEIVRASKSVPPALRTTQFTIPSCFVFTLSYCRKFIQVLLLPRSSEEIYATTLFRFCPNKEI